MIVPLEAVDNYIFTVAKAFNFLHFSGMSESPQAESVTMFGVELIPESEVARILRKTKSALVEMRARRLGPCFHKIGGSVYYAPDDVRKWLESTRVITKGFGDGTPSGYR
jgi:hypothetical protein